MENLKNTVRNFYNLVFDRYKDRDYALAITAMHFSIYREKIEELLK